MALLDPILPYVEEVNRFADYPIVGRGISRGRIITSVQACPKVWSFGLTVATPALRWDEYYEFIEDVRTINMTSPFSFSFLAGAELAYLTPYRGTLSSVERAAVTVAATPGVNVQISLANLPATRTNVFRKGDFIQAIGDPKPYTVTADVNSNASGAATLSLSRPLFTYPAVGTKLYYGNQVSWTCYFSKLPEPSSISTYLNGLQWNGTFEFTETA